MARYDYNASEVILKLFESYYRNPRLLHKGTLHRIFAETLMHKDERVSNSAVDLNDCAIKIVDAEIEDICSIAIHIEENEIENTEDENDELIEIFEEIYVNPENFVRFEKRKY